jgi:Uncharacterized protein conserved in bacteria
LEHKATVKIKEYGAPRPRLPLPDKAKKALRVALPCALAALLVVAVLCFLFPWLQSENEKAAFQKLAAQAVPRQTDSHPSETPASLAQPSETPVMLESYSGLYAQNSDMAGWIRIDGTEIDYPVMFTPDDGEFYIDHGFDKNSSKSGVPFIDKRCAVDPPGTNTIIYGHHMKNGAMFAGLLAYEDEAFYKAHPLIRFDSLYEHREYEIIAVFRSQIYRKRDRVFKFYNFLNAADPADFDEYIANIKALSLYDTGLGASYGDELITLVTCAYHTENGEFAVIARKIG